MTAQSQNYQYKLFYAENSNQSILQINNRLKVKTNDLYHQPKYRFSTNKPLHKRIKEAYHIHSVTDMNSHSKNTHLKSVSNAKLDSQQPEIVCNWLDEFQNEISKKIVGTSYQYPASKYEHFSTLVDSKGYRRVKNMKKQQKLPQFVKQMRQELRKIHSRMDMTGQSQKKQVK